MATTSVGTMRAILQDAYGTSDVWRVGETAVPEYSEKEVLVKVEAAGLDRGTWHLMTGLPYLGRLAFGLRKPKNPVPGRDLAGTVAAVGASVTRFAVGDAVYGIGSGSFAEYAVAVEDKLARAPANLTSSQAAAVPISGMTAMRALKDAGRLAKSQRVLIIGASGGVGTYAVQLAKALGSHVTGVCSTPKIDLVRSLGADRVIDYTRDDFADGKERYDLILDIGGDSSLSRLRRALSPKGTLVIVGGEGGGKLTGMGRQLQALVVSPFLRQRLTMLVPKEHYSDLEELTAYIEAGTVTPNIDRTYPLDQAADAMQQLTAGKARAARSPSPSERSLDPGTRVRLRAPTRPPRAQLKLPAFYQTPRSGGSGGSDGVIKGASVGSIRSAQASIQSATPRTWDRSSRERPEPFGRSDASRVHPASSKATDERPRPALRRSSRGALPSGATQHASRVAPLRRHGGHRVRHTPRRT